MDTLRWLRVIGDTIFAADAVALGLFVMGLRTGWSVRNETDPAMKEEETSLARSPGT